eukprot:11192775-Lingulodinium_polyedra.AAC.1
MSPAMRPPRPRSGHILARAREEPRPPRGQAPLRRGQRRPFLRPRQGRRGGGAWAALHPPVST